MRTLGSPRWFSPLCRPLRIPVGHLRFFCFALVACLLTLSHGEGLRGQEAGSDLGAAPVLLGREGSIRPWEGPEMPIPSFFAQEAKEEPAVNPGIARGVGRLVKTEFRQAVRRYRSGDWEGAVESLSRVIETSSESELGGYAYYVLGESWYRLGRLDEGLPAFEKVIEAYPGHPLRNWAYYSIGWIHLEREDFQQALHYLRAVGRSQEEDPLVATAFFWEGEALGMAGQAEEAVTCKRRFLELYPKHSRVPLVHWSMGVYLFRLQRFEEAAEVFRQFAAIYPSHPLREDAVYGLGLSLIYAEEYDEGISILKDSLERCRDTPRAGSVLLALVQGYLEKDEGAGALTIYHELMARFPHFEWRDDPLFRIGCFYLQRGEYQQAAEVYQDLLEVHPGSDLKAWVYLYLGEAFHNLGDFGKAIDSFQLAEYLSADPLTSEEALFKMGRSFYQQGNPQDAIDSWSRLVKDFPHSTWVPEATYGMAEVFLQNRNPEQAMAVFKGLDDLGDFHPRILNSLGRYYLRTGEWSLAIQHLRELIDRYPSHPLSKAAYLSLCESFSRRRDYPNALSCLEESVEQGDPESMDRAYFIQGRIYYTEGKFDLAIERFLTVMNRSPESPWAAEAQYWIAWSHYRMGAYESAMEEFRKVRDHPPSPQHAVQALLRIGDCHDHLGSYVDASLVYLEVARDFPESAEVPEAEYGALLAFEHQGRYDHFLERAKAFLATRPSHPLGANILSKVAQYYAQSNQADEAINAYRQVLRRYPRSALADDAQFKLGEIYREEGDLQNAALEFGQLVKQYPRSDYLVEAYFEMAQSYFALGDYRRALEGYERVVGRFPDGPLAGDAHLRAIECYERLDRGDLAERRLVEVMQSYPDESIRCQAALRLGLILSGTMRYGEAVEVLREATKSRDPQVASLAQLQIGEAYRTMGDHHTAVAELMKAVHLYPGQARQVEKALFSVGEIYLAEKRWSHAKEIFGQVIEVSQSEAVRGKAQAMILEIERATENQ